MMNAEEIINILKKNKLLERRTLEQARCRNNRDYQARYVFTQVRSETLKAGMLATVRRTDFPDQIGRNQKIWLGQGLALQPMQLLIPRYSLGKYCPR